MGKKCIVHHVPFNACKWLNRQQSCEITFDPFLFWLYSISMGIIRGRKQAVWVTSCVRGEVWEAETQRLYREMITTSSSPPLLDNAGQIFITQQQSEHQQNIQSWTNLLGPLGTRTEQSWIHLFFCSSIISHWTFWLKNCNLSTIIQQTKMSLAAKLLATRDTTDTSHILQRPYLPVEQNSLIPHNTSSGEALWDFLCTFLFSSSDVFIRAGV